MGRRSRLEFVSIPLLEGGRVDQHPSFSLASLFSYNIFPYLMLTLGSSFNTKGNSLMHRSSLQLEFIVFFRIELHSGTTTFESVKHNLRYVSLYIAHILEPYG